MVLPLYIFSASIYILMRIRRGQAISKVMNALEPLGTCSTLSYSEPMGCNLSITPLYITCALQIVCGYWCVFFFLLFSGCFTIYIYRVFERGLFWLCRKIRNGIAHKFRFEYKFLLGTVWFKSCSLIFRFIPIYAGFYF